MVFSDQDITSIIQDVERQVLGLASDTLKKGEGSKSADAGGPPDDGGLPPGAEGSASSSGSASSASPPDAGDPSAPPAAPADSAAASAPPPGAPPAGDPSAAGAPPPDGQQDPMMGDHEALVAEFAKLPPEHVAQILEAAKQVLLAQQPAGAPPAASPMEPSAPPAGLAQSEVGEGGLDGGVPAGQGGKQVPANGKASGLQEVASNGGAPMSGGKPESGNMHSNLSGDGGVKSNTTVAAKNEGGNVLSPPAESGNMHANLSGNGGVKSNTTVKSEADERIAALEKANKELNIRVEQLIGLTTEIVERPVRKAVTGLDYNPKPSASPAPKAMSREEMTRRIMDKLKDPSLSKSDRQAVTDAYETRNFSKIEHLLK